MAVLTIKATVKDNGDGCWRVHLYPHVTHAGKRVPNWVWSGWWGKPPTVNFSRNPQGTNPRCHYPISEMANHNSHLGAFQSKEEAVAYVMDIRQRVKGAIRAWFARSRT